MGMPPCPGSSTATRLARRASISPNEVLRLPEPDAGHDPPRVCVDAPNPAKVAGERLAQLDCTAWVA